MKAYETKVRLRREALKISQRQLAARLRALPSAVCQIERHGIRTIRLARQYAAALECGALELMD